MLYFNLNNICIGQARVSDLAFSIDIKSKNDSITPSFTNCKKHDIISSDDNIIEFVDLSVHVRHVYKFHYNWTEI